MKLTRKKAIAISIELWTSLAETGKHKWDWGGWRKYGLMAAYCPFCEFSAQQEGMGCDSCPYYQEFGDCVDDTPYRLWCNAETEEERKKYAKEFLAQLLYLKGE